MQFFCREQREAGTQIEAHLIAKYGSGAGTRTIRLVDTVIHDVPHQVQVGGVSRVGHFLAEMNCRTCILQNG